MAYSCIFVNIQKILKTVISVRIYHGNFKIPYSSHEFLNPFSTEIKSILNNSISISNKKLTFKVIKNVCNAYAKSFELNVKNFNAYHGCNSCIVEGSFIYNRIAFLDINASLRTNDTFRIKCDEFYHEGTSLLEVLPIHIISTLLLKYMHSICLGVMKRLIIF